MKQQPIKFRRLRCRQAGFTLAELMIASTIGIFIVAGAIGVFTANREAARYTQSTDSNQDALRYVAHTISRVVRVGHSFSGTADGQLEVWIPTGFEDCLGKPLEKAASNIFTIARNTVTGKNELQCRVTDGDPQTLVEGLADANGEIPGFSVELLRPDPDITKPDALVKANSEQATSVRIGIAMETDDGEGQKKAIQFVATMRCKIFGCDGG
jgi:prepilin-type N-terminal cleavage/methylation domain-containing protein